MRICNVCNEEKTLELFSWSRRKDGTKYYRLRCKSCVSKICVKQKQDKAKVDSEFAEKRKTRAREYSRKNKIRNPDSVAKNARRQTWRKRGIDPALAEDYYQSHNGVCEICGNISDKTLHMDHCHTTGKIRGMLCMRCNALLGYAKESRRTLILAIDYLNKHNS